MADGDRARNELLVVTLNSVLAIKPLCLNVQIVCLYRQLSDP